MSTHHRRLAPASGPSRRSAAARAWLTIGLVAVAALTGGCQHEARRANADDDPDAARPDAALDARARPDQRLDDRGPSDQGTSDRDLPDEGLDDQGVADASTPDTSNLPDEVLPPLPSTCAAQRGMVGVPFPDGTCYLMDAWPVTRGEYAAALAGGPLRSQHPACVGHEASGPRSGSSFNPVYLRYCEINYVGYCELGDEEGPCEILDLRMPWPPESTEALEPMVCVEWCDAEAYCAAQGKRLCSHRGMSADAPYQVDELRRVEQDEMSNACTASGNPRFPHGIRADYFNPTQPGPLARENLTIEGGYEGIFGLGVSFEWRGPHFKARHGSAEFPDAPCEPESLRYHEFGVGSPSLYGPFHTFRCCADADP